MTASISLSCKNYRDQVRGEPPLVAIQPPTLRQQRTRENIPVRPFQLQVQNDDPRATLRVVKEQIHNMQSNLPGPTGDPLHNVNDAPHATGVTKQKSKVKDLLKLYDIDPIKHVERLDDLLGVQKFSTWVLRSAKFENFFGFLVILDLILIATELDHYDKATVFFDATGALINLMFVLELVLRVAANPATSLCDKLLLFDICLVSVSLLDLALFLGKTSSPTQKVDLGWLLAFRVFRLFRMLRLAGIVKVKALTLLIDAMHGSLEPILGVLVLTSLLLLGAAVMVTMLVPTAAAESEIAREILLQHYGTIDKSFQHLLLNMAAGYDWGVSVAFPLFKHAESGSLVLLLVLVVANLVLSLTLSGLVAGIFLQELLEAADREEERNTRVSMAQQHHLLSQLDKEFKALGMFSGDIITHSDFNECILKSPSLNTLVSMSPEHINSFFMQLENNGQRCVTVDELIFSIFKQQGKSKSVDMLSIDYQQDKAHTRIQELQQTMHVFIGFLHARLMHIADQLPILHKRVTDVRDLAGEVLQFEKELVEKRKAKLSLKTQLGGILEGETTSRVSIEELQLDYALQTELGVLETAVKELKRGKVPHMKCNKKPGDAPELVEQIAEELMNSLQQALQEELALSRVTAAGVRQRLLR